MCAYNMSLWHLLLWIFLSSRLCGQGLSQLFQLRRMFCLESVITLVLYVKFHRISIYPLVSLRSILKYPIIYINLHLYCLMCLQIVSFVSDLNAYHGHALSSVASSRMRCNSAWQNGQNWPLLKNAPKTKHKKHITTSKMTFAVYIQTSHAPLLNLPRISLSSPGS